MSGDSTRIVEFDVEVVEFLKGFQDVVLIIDGRTLQFSVSDVVFEKIPVVLGEPNRIKVPKWVVLSKDLDHLL